MYKHILIATDGSDLAQKGVRHGLTLAKTFGSKATVVTATEPWTSVVAGEMGVAFPIDEYDKACAANAAKILTAVSALAKEIGIGIDTLHAKDTFPADGIVDAAKRLDCDLIVMASHGRRGVSRLLLGSQANKVVTHSSVPVLIVR